MDMALSAAPSKRRGMKQGSTELGLQVSCALGKRKASVLADFSSSCILVTEPKSIYLCIVGLFVRNIVLSVHRRNRASRFTSSTVNALLRVDVQNLVNALFEVNAVYWAHVHTRLVHRVNTGCGNHIRHTSHTFQFCIPLSDNNATTSPLMSTGEFFYISDADKPSSIGISSFSITAPPSSSGRAVSATSPSDLR